MPHLATVAHITLHPFVLAATTKAKSSSSTTTILFLVVIVGIGYFLLIRPQRQRARKAQQQGQNIDVGDEVMLTSGIFGHVTSMDGDRATVEIAPDIEIEVVTRAIAQRIAPADAVPAPELVSPDPAGDEDEDFAHASDDPSGDEDEDSDHDEDPDDAEGAHDDSEPDHDETAWPPTAVRPAADDTGNSVPGGGIVGGDGRGQRRRSRRETS
jgi:preprotein translocase subunit YajC